MNWCCIFGRHDWIYYKDERRCIVCDKHQIYVYAGFSEYLGHHSKWMDKEKPRN